MEPQGRHGASRQPFFTRSVLLSLGTLAAAGVLFFVFAIPPAPAPVDVRSVQNLAARMPAGAYHIHTTRSDGLGDKNAVASAAQRAGLAFVIITDHGDGTRTPDPPVYIDGVLCLDGVEISTDNGHYVALDMPPAPYRLGGAGEAVVEDVHRLGGFGVTAHPDSAKPELRWTDGFDAIDGIEWFNLDSEWRKDSRTRLARAGLGYLVRPAPALATLFDRPPTFGLWDRLTTRRAVVGLAAVDAHGGVHKSAVDGREASLSGIPSYEASFRAITNRVVLDAPLTGDAAADARAIYRAIRTGRVYSVVDAVAAPALLDFHAEAPTGLVPMGGAVARATSATLVARAPMPPGAVLLLLRAGREVARSMTGDLRFYAAAPGAYRVEIHVSHAPGNPPVPWVVSNPIYVGLPARFIEERLGTLTGPAPEGSLSWRIEKDPTSEATLRTPGHAAELKYTLGAGKRADQYVALATDVRLTSQSAIHLQLKGDRPMRVSVQMRDTDGQRWGRSFYVAPEGTTVVTSPTDLRPIGQATPVAPDPGSFRSVLLVVDLTNASPGQSGTLTVSGSGISN